MIDQPEPGDMYEDITRELQRLFPPDRMERIIDRLGLEGTDDDLEYLGDLISAIFTRGIEFGAIEVAAQQVQATPEVYPQIDIAHVDLP
ncbi:MAG TPA: hypothetical protein VG186_09190 [Solirubrobacteraceae bacterium]|nr:hypothetical protein [Solirubrobacteraceae bacterium]